MTVLALDMATRSGWAVADMTAAPIPGPLFETNGFEFQCRSGVKQFPKGADVGPLLARYEEWVNDLITVHAPKLVAVEATLPRQNNEQTMIKLVSLLGVTEKVCHQRSTRIVKEPIEDIVRHAVNKGRDTGKKLRKERAEQLGWGDMDDNEIDARFLLSLMLQKLANARRQT